MSGRLLGQVAQFFASIVLARLLLPSAYGLVAITWTLTGFAALFSDLGLGAALVQSSRVTERDAATAFVINEVLRSRDDPDRDRAAPSAGRPSGPAACREPARARESDLHALGQRCPVRDPRRRMQFATVAALDVVATVGLAASIVCAARGVGAESLVIGPLATAAVLSVGALAAARWVPKAWPSRSSARRMMGFSGHLTGFNVPRILGSQRR